MQPGQPLSPALCSKAIKWVSMTPSHLSAWSPAWYHRNCVSGQKWLGWVREEARQENSSTALRRNNKNSERLEFMTCWYTTFVTTSPGKVILLHFTDGETETERGCDVHRPGVESLTCLTSVRHSFYCRPVKVRLRLESGSCLPACLPESQGSSAPSQRGRAVTGSGPCPLPFRRIESHFLLGWTPTIIPALGCISWSLPASQV